MCDISQITIVVLFIVKYFYGDAMNKQDYYSNKSKCKKYYKRIQELLTNWKAENNIVERCVVHHRDDTDECRKYNEEHYELWGFNLDGTFEYGKYVVFMTHAEHSSYHNTGHDRCKGENNPFYNCHHTDEQRIKWSLERKGRKLTEEWKQHISENNAHISGMKGKQHSETSRKQISENNAHYWKGKTFSDEARKRMSEAKKGKPMSEEHKQQLKNMSKALVYMYDIYKQNGGILKWNDFRKELKNGNISFNNETPFSVFINYGE